LTILTENPIEWLNGSYYRLNEDKHNRLFLESSDSDYGEFEAVENFAGTKLSAYMLVRTLLESINVSNIGSNLLHKQIMNILDGMGYLV